MKNISAKKNWLSGDITDHVEPPPTPLVKSESKLTKKE